MAKNWAAVAEAINNRLAELDITQQELASRSGVSSATLRELQHNKAARRRQPRLLAAVSEGLGWPSDHLRTVLERVGNNVNSQPLYLQLADTLRGGIAAGTYPVGSALPSSSQLQDEHQVSVTVVRDAMKELKREGLVEGQPGVAVYVERRPDVPTPTHDPQTPGHQIVGHQIVDLHHSSEVRPLNVLVADDLRRRVSEEEFLVGQRFPSLRDLATYYGVAELTVHTAVRELQREGVLVSTIGRGTFVRAVPASPVNSSEAVWTELRAIRAELRDLQELSRGHAEALAAMQVNLDLLTRRLHGNQPIHPSLDEQQ